VKLHELAPAPGSRRPRRRVGRGTSGRRGKTAGRGMKGQGARDNVKPGFEGGQLPLMQRIPKLRGFTNPFRVEYTPVNLDVLQEIGATECTPDSLAEAGVVRRGVLVKVLGRGRIDRAVLVKAHAFSRSAEAAITAAGGRVEVLPLPYAQGRPPAKGNALTNR
jgi:large subunit ribosomal protein L15